MAEAGGEVHGYLIGVNKCNSDVPFFVWFLPGVGFALRKIANSSTPTVEVTRNDDEFSFKTQTLLKTYYQKFKLGVTADDTSLDDVAIKVTMTLEGDNVLKEIQDRPDGKKTEIIREFSDEDMKVVSFFLRPDCQKVRRLNFFEISCYEP